MDIRDDFITNVYQEEVYFVSVARCLDSSVAMLYYGNRDDRALKKWQLKPYFCVSFCCLNVTILMIIWEWWSDSLPHPTTQAFKFGFVWEWGFTIRTKIILVTKKKKRNFMLKSTNK